jgi:soluble lytic murein transglycosylase
VASGKWQVAGEEALRKVRANILPVLLLIIFILLIRDFFFLGNQYQRAKKHFEDKQYAQAIPLFYSVSKHNRLIADYALFYLAESCLQEKRLNEAERYYRQLIEQYPKNPYCRKAVYHVVQLKTMKGIAVSAEEQFGYAQGLFEERAYGPALVQFKRAVVLHLPKELKGEAWHYLGLCSFYQRQYLMAVNYFILARGYPHQYSTKTIWWLAKTYQRLNRQQEALYSYRQLYTMYPEFELAPEALVEAAEIYSSWRMYMSASKLYVLLRQRYPQHRSAGESYWREGRNNYYQRNYWRAYQLFSEGVERAGDSAYGGALCYWSGKAALKLGDEATAKVYFNRTVREYDHNYYAYRAAQQLNIPLPYIKKGKLPWIMGVSQWGEKYQALLIQKACDDALAEIKDALATADAQVKAQTYYELAIASLDNELYFNGLQYLERCLMTRVIPVQDLPYNFWMAYYPRPYFKFIKDSAKRNNVEWQMICGLIREESAFDTRSVSYVGARGLMQLMPATAQLLMKKKSFPLEILYEPRLNLALGTLYIGGLLRDVDNNIVVALAGYNAGPHTVKRWLRLRPIKDIDEWIELIPYGETREYVKRVMRSYWEYCRIYP